MKIGNLVVRAKALITSILRAEALTTKRGMQNGGAILEKTGYILSQQSSQHLIYI